MAYRVTAKIRKGKKSTEVFIVQYGGSMLHAGHRAFDKAQKLIAQPDRNGYHVVSAKVVRTS